MSNASSDHASGQRDTGQDRDEHRRPGFWSIVGSTLAAAFGVQSRKNQERDFSKGNIVAFIVAGVLFTTAFVIGVILVVQMVLNQAGAA